MSCGVIKYEFSTNLQSFVDLFFLQNLSILGSIHPPLNLHQFPSPWRWEALHYATTTMFHTQDGGVVHAREFCFGFGFCFGLSTKTSLQHSRWMFLEMVFVFLPSSHYRPHVCSIFDIVVMDDGLNGALGSLQSLGYLFISLTCCIDFHNSFPQATALFKTSS